jgi:hypothetical protein
MSNSITKKKLSGSTDGKPILITATATAGTLLHTAQAGTGTGDYDEIWLWLSNTSASDVVVTIEFGGATAPDFNIKYTVLAQDGLKCVIPGLILQNGATVKAFAATGSVINAVGFINEIDHS